MRRILTLLIAILFSLSGCASLTGYKRGLVGVTAGASLGATGGAVLSPNDESRALNALVFGLSGALVGGLTAWITDSNEVPPSTQVGLKDRDPRVPQDLLVQPTAELPQFVKDRLQPLVIEEFVQKDTVTEEGTLHEPHKVYRIKRMPELFPSPVQESSGGKSK